MQRRDGAAAAERRPDAAMGGVGVAVQRTAVRGNRVDTSRSGPETNEMIANAIGGISRANGDASEVSVLTVSASMAQRTKSVCEYATEA